MDFFGQKVGQMCVTVHITAFRGDLTGVKQHGCSGSQCTFPDLASVMTSSRLHVLERPCHLVLLCLTSPPRCHCSSCGISSFIALGMAGGTVMTDSLLVNWVCILTAINALKSG